VAVGAILFGSGTVVPEDTRDFITYAMAHEDGPQYLGQFGERHKELCRGNIGHDHGSSE
jgi:hypothetical protein